MEIKDIQHKDGKLMTGDEIFSLFHEKMQTALEALDENDQLSIGNERREKEGYAELNKNMETDLNEVLSGVDPYVLLRMGDEDWDYYSDYFQYDGCDLSTTDDVWCDLDIEDIAEDLLTGEFTPEIPGEIQDIIDEYNEALNLRESYNPYRAECVEIISKFTNCEADVTDLLQVLSKLALTDDAWGE